MRRMLHGIFIGMLVIATATAASAHEAEDAGHNHYTVFIFEQIDAAGLPAYEAATREWVAEFKEGDSGFNWFTATGPGLTYAYLMGVGSYAELDEMEARFNEAFAGLEKERVGELMAGEKYVKRRWRELLKERQDLSYGGTGAAQPPGVIHVTVMTVKPEMQHRFEELLGKARAAYAKAEHPHGYEVYQVEFGQGSYVLVTQAADPAELYSRPEAPEVLAAALGAEKARALLDEWLACVSDYRSDDWTPRMDLSLMPAPAEEASE